MAREHVDVARTSVGFRQYANSISQIVKNPHVRSGRGLARHSMWQVRKLFDRFPFEQKISRSRIIATDRGCATAALIFSQGIYDYDNMSLLQRVLEHGGTFLDIGANVGSYTLIASEQPLASVHGFEPHPGTFRRLEQNVELNHRSNVTLHNLALGSTEGNVFFTDDKEDTLNRVVPAASRPAGTIVVTSRRLDALCRELAISPQVVKIDVEGFEYDVLEGFGDQLSSVDLLIVEMNEKGEERGPGVRDVHALLTAAGFRGPWECNFDRGHFRPHTTRSREDPIYVSDAFRARAADLGLTFPDGL